MIHFTSPLFMYAGIGFIVILLATVFFVRRSRRNNAALDSGEALESSQLYVGNLPYRMRERQLREFFEKFGSIDNIRIIKNHHNGRSKGFGFVTFSSDKEAQKALKTNGEMFEGRPMVVRIAKAKA